MEENCLFAKMSKCYFGVEKVEYLGHFLSREGVSTNPAKVTAVKDWPLPSTLKQLRGFLGLAGYYKRFVKGYGGVAKPLTEMLKKDSFSWTPEAKNALEQLKELLITTLVLALPDFSRPFVVEVDASGTSLGAVLMQDHHPIEYVSRALSV
ncbi:PREDICTED: uncharacterized protein LOC109344538 [Lupinus angustifolius]|uniref:uncharacterized protein LOC109344538 n=1 Tax=Lupinus angustifolius TaxID=3871 RepID=UPI00092F6657|nr:PREDICTED: uncharacterized protein LOC109344538 [Lupinus angustifolius]